MRRKELTLAQTLDEKQTTLVLGSLLPQYIQDDNDSLRIQ